MQIKQPGQTKRAERYKHTHNAFYVLLWAFMGQKGNREGSFLSATGKHSSIYTYCC